MPSLADSTAIAGLVLIVALAALAAAVLWQVRVVGGAMAEMREDLRKVLEAVRELKAPKKARTQESQVSQARSDDLDNRLLHETTVLINQRFDKFFSELETEIAGIRTQIERLGAQIVAPIPKLQAMAVAGGVEFVTGAASLPGTGLKPFVPEMVDSYNRSEADFRDRYAPRTAELQEGKQLAPHSAGSFWIVESPFSDYYCLPRPRRITPNFHENVGLKQLFRYDGYDPKGPERDFSVEQPATLLPGSGYGWSVIDRGVLQLRNRED